MTKKKIIKGSVIFIIYVAILVYLISYVLSNAEIMEKITNASLVYIVFGIGTTIINYILMAWLDITCAKTYMVSIHAFESVGLTFIASSINLVVPLQFGSVLKAMYFKKKMSLAYSKYISIVSGTGIVTVVVTIGQLILCLILSAFRWNVEKVYIIGLIVAFIVGIIFFSLIVRHQEMILNKVPFKRYTLPVMQGFFELINDNRTMIGCICNRIIASLLGGLRFFFIFRILGVKTDVLSGMLYYGIFSASSVIPILPGNIGISEVLVGIMNSILGSEFDIGVTVVLIERFYYYFVAIMGALLSALPVWKMYNKDNIEKQ